MKILFMPTINQLVRKGRFVPKIKSMSALEGSAKRGVCTRSILRHQKPNCIGAKVKLVNGYEVISYIGGGDIIPRT